MSVCDWVIPHSFTAETSFPQHSKKESAHWAVDVTAKIYFWYMIPVLTYWGKSGKSGKSCSLQEKYLHSTHGIRRKTIYFWRDGNLFFPKTYSFPRVLWRHLSYCNHYFPIFPRTLVPFLRGRNHMYCHDREWAWRSEWNLKWNSIFIQSVHRESVTINICLKIGLLKAISSIS